MMPPEKQSTCMATRLDRPLSFARLIVEENWTGKPRTLFRRTAAMLRAPGALGQEMPNLIYPFLTHLKQGEVYEKHKYQITRIGSSSRGLADTWQSAKRGHSKRAGG